jgi:spore coat protein CotH
MKLYFKYITFICFSFISYEKEPVTIIEREHFPDYVVPHIIPKGNEQYLEKKSEYVFDQEKLPTYQLLLPTASLSKIDADPTKEEYVEGTLIFEGDTISPVGIRYKGALGTFSPCTSGTDWANPTGSKTCTKLSIKVKINWEGREEKFYGLKKLQFHAQNNDI